MPRQNEYNWIFGNRIWLDFNSGPTPTLVNLTDATSIYEGTATISDDNGNLIACCDGSSLWDRQHTQINTFPLGGNDSSTHSCIIVPPVNNGQNYHIFTVSDDLEHPGPDNVQHATFNLVGNNINLTSQNTVISPVGWDNTERLAATSHTNCGTYWVVTQNTVGGFRSFLIDSDQAPSTFEDSSSNFPNWTDDSIHAGYMKFSPDGNLLAYAQRSPSSSFGFISVHAFDRNTGQVSDLFRITSVSDPYGLEFSSDGQYVYFSLISNGAVYRHPTSSPNVTLADTQEVFQQANYGVTALQLGPYDSPNDTIFGKTSNNSLLAITDTNNAIAPVVNNSAAINQLPSGGLPTNGLSLPTFTRVARECLNALCGMEVISTECDENGNHRIVIEMSDHSNNAQVNMSIDIDGLPNNMYAVSTTVSGSVHRATIVIDGIFSGPISLTGSLSGLAGKVGARLCCKRSLDLEIEACAEDCLEIKGKWKKGKLCFMTTSYDFTVTNTSTNPSFQPDSVEITNLPQGAFLAPNPVPLVNGVGTGRVLIGNTIPTGTEMGLLFHTENWDQCCNKWINLKVP